MRNKKRKREAEEKRTQEEKETYKAYSIVEKKGGGYIKVSRRRTWKLVLKRRFNERH